MLKEKIGPKTATLAITPPNPRGKRSSNVEQRDRSTISNSGDHNTGRGKKGKPMRKRVVTTLQPPIYVEKLLPKRPALLYMRGCSVFPTMYV